jgi:hypothetical protein
MITGPKSEREIILNLLTTIDIDAAPHHIKPQLMQALGFEQDVPFAKSLFSDTLAQIYKAQQ